MPRWRTIIHMFGQKRHNRFAEKSYYSLGYCYEASEKESAAATKRNRSRASNHGDEDELIFEDYSRIIEELRSHRREIERLQTDFAAAPSVTQAGGGGAGAAGSGSRLTWTKIQFFMASWLNSSICRVCLGLTSSSRSCWPFQSSRLQRRPD